MKAETIEIAKKFPKIGGKTGKNLLSTKSTNPKMTFVENFDAFSDEKNNKINKLTTSSTNLQNLQRKKPNLKLTIAPTNSPTNVGLACQTEFSLCFEETVEKITMYRSVLEQTYIDADHDDWHGDGMPQKFRVGDHTYDEMKIALARFIKRVHGHEEEVAAAVIAFEKSQETLLEHQEYLKIQKMFPICNTPQLKKQSELAWQDCMRAYKKLPEYKVLMSAKKRQCLFDPLMDKQPSKEHIQDLVNSLATS
jgi:hypothetical protein